MFEIIHTYIANYIENLVATFLECLAMQDFNDPVLGLHAVIDFIRIVL